ncbi:MAG TPA: IPT/TIG domain-containing protein [Candidatus Acidoferrum sp.]|nr:IPT/TIG domain-containing protein [Candidatus Acidoferrum sp.]
MRLLKSASSIAFFLSTVGLFVCAGSVSGQEKPASPDQSGAPASRRPLPANKQPAKVAPNEEQESSFAGASANDADGPEALRKRAEWFYKQRSSVGGHIPAGARFKAFQHMQQMMLREGKLTQRLDGSYAEVAPQSWLSPLGAVTSPWTSIGPTPTTGGFFSPVTGRVTTIAVDPSDSTGNTVLIGGAMGGIWRTTDGGASWTAVGDQNASLAMGSIAFAPSNHSIVYAATGESESVAFDIYYGAGVLKSMDGGLTWTQTCTTASSTCPFIGPYNDITPFGFFTLGGTRITYVAVSPSNPQLVLVAAQTQFAQGTTEGVYCSDNGGSTWSNILPDQLSSFVGFASSTVAYAALGNPFGSSPNAPNGNGVYKATSIGSTCSTIHFSRLAAASLPLQSSMGRIDMGIAPSDTLGNTVYASIADSSTSSSTNLGVFVTTNGGTSWTQTAAPDICKFQCWYDNVVKVDPNNKNIVFFGGSSVRDSSTNPSWVIRTQNGGTSWSSVIPSLPGGSAGLPHVDNHAIAFVKLPTGKVRMYLGNDGGVWRTDDAEASTVTWTNLNNPGLTLTQFYPFISMNASQPSISFGGTQDNGSQNFQGGTAWLDNQQCGDGGTTAVDEIIPSTVYIGCITGFPVNASYQNGAIGTFSPAVNGINPSDFIGVLAPLVTDPSNANTAYFGTTKVYQSVDAGNTWTPISNDLVNGSSFDSLNVIAVAPANPGVVYVGANTGNSIGQLTGLVFTSTNVTPGNFSNFFQVSGQVLLPPRALTAIAIDPADTTGMTAYVTFSGFSFVISSPNFNVNDPTGHIFKTTNGGATWNDVSCSVAVCTTPAATDLPNIPVNDLVIDPDVPGTLYAATDLGVFVGNCSASPCIWSTLSTGLPRVVVHSLRLLEPSRTLRAATHGRGAWDINLNNFSFTGPHISSITPSSANVGGAQFTLTVNGSGLANGAVQWNGSATGVTTTQVSDTQLTATIAASLLTLAGTPKITVVNGTQTSNAITFSVLAAIPTLTSISPTSTPVQTSPSTPVQIQLTGTNFSSNVKVFFNSAQNGITVAAPTASCQPPTCITATLPAALLGPFGGTDSISVTNLPPGGGQSKPLNFQVVAPPPPNDNFANAIDITTSTFVKLTDVQDSSGAATESTDPTPPCAQQFTMTQGNTGGQPNGRYNTIWYKFTPPFSANLNVDTSGSNYDTVLSVWTGTQGSLTNLACNDDIVQGVNIQSQISNIPLTSGTTYYVMVSSFGPPDPNPIALGGRSQLNFVYNNGFYPPAVITSIAPTSANSGDPSFTLTVNGSGFFNGATVFIEDPSSVQTQLATTLVSPTQLTALVPASVILFPGNYSVFVSGGQYSGVSSFGVLTVNVGKYPVPTLNSISPNTVVATSLPLFFTAQGTDFAANAVVNFNGQAIPVTVVTANHAFLQTTIPSTAFATPGNLQVTVSNPSPGGGPSNSLPFTITAPQPQPTISSVTPSSISADVQIVVTIVGTGFLSGVNVFVINSDGSRQGFFNPTTSRSTQLSVTFFLDAGQYSLYVVDPSPGGTSAPFNFTVTGPPDFSITSSGTSTQTVNAGQTAAFSNTISVTAQNGFASQVNLSCSLPVTATGTTCAVNPNMLASGSGTASVSVNTTSRGLLPPSLHFRRFYLRPEIVALLLLTLVVAILMPRVARTRRLRLVGALPLTVLLLIILLQAIGCGGGGGSTPPPPTGTPAGTYTVTVTGTSGNLTHSTTLTLTVN